MGRRPRLRRLIVLTVTLLIALASPAHPVAAEEPPPPSPDTTAPPTDSSSTVVPNGPRRGRSSGQVTAADGEVAVGARAEGSVSGEPAGVGSGRRCVTTRGGAGVMSGASSFRGDVPSMAATDLVDGSMYWRLCQIGPDHWDNQGGFVYRRSDPRPPDVVASEALAAIQIPAPVPSTSPGQGLPQVVGLPTWLWIDPTTWTPLAASVDAGGFAVTATVTPTSVHWDMGEDPDTRSRWSVTGPGPPMTSGDPTIGNTVTAPTPTGGPRTPSPTPTTPPTPSTTPPSPPPGPSPGTPATAKPACWPTSPAPPPSTCTSPKSKPPSATATPPDCDHD